jgi:mono/diheme cytochrome c family protein
MRWLLLLLPAFASAAPLSPLAERGRAVMEAAQCNRCHPVSGGLEPAARDMNCVGCHTWILGTRGDAAAIAKERAEYPDWDRYLENVVHFTRLPDLGTLARRVDPAFIRRFLDGPFDLRPHLDESMIPVRLAPADKDAVVAYLAELAGDAVARPVAEPPVPDGRVAAGRALFAARGCPTCHVFGDARFGVDARAYAAVKPAALLAPNLRYVRERIPRAVLVRFLVDPQSVDPAATMPRLGVTPAEAESLADFLMQGDPELPAAAPFAEADVKPLARRVTFDEVYDEVFGRVCVHCHMDPASNHGDGGAGNTGGLGFAGAGLNLETPEGIRRGLLRDGKRVSVLSGARPLLLEALLRRRHEARRDHRVPFGDCTDPGEPTPTAQPGMPLGLPPLSDAQIRLVATWLAQGAPM